MEEPLDRVVHGFKYRGSTRLARPLGRLLAARVPIPSADAVLSVPLHPSRRRDRGYDQAELLARAAASVWGLPLAAGVLVRRRATRAQARLGSEARRANVAGAFAVTAPVWVRGRHLVVIDDVITTGSTLEALLEVLEEAGAARVSPVALALA